MKKRYAREGVGNTPYTIKLQIHYDPIYSPADGIC